MRCSRPSQEVGIGIKDGVARVRVSELYYRPAEVDLLIGNPAKAVAKLGWNPQSTPFTVLPHRLVAFASLFESVLTSPCVLRHSRRSWYVKWCPRTASC